MVASLPGSNLFQLFAWMTDALLYRASNLPETEMLPFLSVHGTGRGSAPFVSWYNPNQGRRLTRDLSGILPDTLLFGNRYGLFRSNPVKPFLEIGRRHSNRSTIADHADPYVSETTPPPPSEPPP
jgi:hypothetical protein